MIYLYRAWLYIQLAFWTLVSKLEMPYIRWQVRRDIKGLEEKGLVVLRGKGKDMAFDLTPLGQAVRKKLVQPDDFRG